MWWRWRGRVGGKCRPLQGVQGQGPKGGSRGHSPWKLLKCLHLKGTPWAARNQPPHIYIGQHFFTWFTLISGMTSHYFNKPITLFIAEYLLQSFLKVTIIAVFRSAHFPSTAWQYICNLNKNMTLRMRAHCQWSFQQFNDKNETLTLLKSPPPPKKKREVEPKWTRLGPVGRWTTVEIAHRHIFLINIRGVIKWPDYSERVSFNYIKVWSTIWYHFRIWVLVVTLFWVWLDQPFELQRYLCKAQGLGHIWSSWVWSNQTKTRLTYFTNLTFSHSSFSSKGLGFWWDVSASHIFLLSFSASLANAGAELPLVSSTSPKFPAKC